MGGRLHGSGTARTGTGMTRTGTGECLPGTWMAHTGVGERLAEAGVACTESPQSFTDDSMRQGGVGDPFGHAAMPRAGSGGWH